MNKIYKNIFFLFFGLLFFCCGSKVEIYEWVRLDYFSLNAQTRDTLLPDASINYQDYVMLVQLNPVNFTTLSSSDWVQASSGFQAKNKITKLEVRTLADYNAAKPAGKLMNDVMDASFIGEGNISENRVFLDDFIDEFGKKSNRIEEGFEIYFRTGGGFASPCFGLDDTPGENGEKSEYLKCFEQSHQFEILIRLSNGSEFTGRTFKVQFTE